MQPISVSIVLLAVSVVVISAEMSFSEFKREFNKSYSTRRKMSGHGLSEDEIRKRIFEHNLQKIERLNEISNGSFEINKYADQTPEEFARTHMGIEPPTEADLEQIKRNSPRMRRTQASAKLPTEWDWAKKGYVIPAKNQGRCGSCWAFSTVGALESYYMRKGYRPDYLSEQQLVDCDKTQGGCNGGWPPRALDHVIRNGIEYERNYPYRARDQQCSFNSRRVSLPKPRSTVSIADEKTLMEALVKYGPMSIVLNADNFQFYRRGIFDVKACPAVNGINHAVLLVGYGTENGVDFWRIKNSWGRGWGEDGYIRLRRNQNTCNMILYPVVAIAS